MAGETQKSSRLTDVQAGKKSAARLAKGNIVVAMDHHQFAAATELEANDALIMDIRIPSNAIVHKIEIYNDDMDTGACPTLALDFGVAAAADFTSITSSTKTKHDADDLIDVDLFVDGDTTAQAATTKWTLLAPDTATMGPDDATKKVWELLGYDADPITEFNLVVVSATASSALGSAADLAVRVTYSVD